MNQLIQFLEKRRGENSIRHLAKELALSHAYVTDVLKGRKQITFTFAARVAHKTGLPPMTAFEMAGLWPPEEEDPGAELRAAKAEFAGQVAAAAGVSNDA